MLTKIFPVVELEGCTVKTLGLIFAGALLTAVTPAAQAMPVSLAHSIGAPNITSSGKAFTHTLALSESPEDEFDQVLLSLDFHVSRNAVAQNDTISLFLGGALQASGQAGSFSVANLDVSDFFDFMTGTLTFELFRDVQRGGGNIKLERFALTLALLSSGNDAYNDVSNQLPPSELLQLSEGANQLQQSQIRQVPEPATLALVGLGMLGMTVFRQRLA